MSTRPGEHQGLGLTHYLWASSPLRRYSDLVNQRQLLAVLDGRKPPYAENDAELFAALADFEATYAQLRRVPGPDGALLVPALAAAGARRRNDGDGDPREPRPLRSAAARRAAAGPAGTCRRKRWCGSRSAASTSWPRRSSAASRDVDGSASIRRTAAAGAMPAQDSGAVVAVRATAASAGSRTAASPKCARLR